MDDAPDPDSPLPAFTPVPRRARRGGWTQDRQRGFIAALAETGNVRMSAERVGMTKEGAYQRRLGKGAESFRRAWAAAQAHGLEGLRDLAIERATEGVVQPVFNGAGRQVAERRVYNDRLLMFTLSHHSGLSKVGAAPREAALAAAREEGAAAARAEAAAEEEERIETLRTKLAAKFAEMEMRLRASIVAGNAPDPSQMSAAERFVLGLPAYPEDLSGAAAEAFLARDRSAPAGRENRDTDPARDRMGAVMLRRGMRPKARHVTRRRTAKRGSRQRSVRTTSPIAAVARHTSA